MTSSDPILYSPALPQNVSGVLAGRVGAFLVDVLMVGFFWAFFLLVVFVLGFFTFGLAWFLIAPLFPMVAVIYNGLTISGPRRGTIGMRVAGLEMRMIDGREVPFVVAAVHVVFYYLSVTILTPLVLVVGLLRSDRRMLHDLLAGVIVVRRQA